MQGSPIGLLLSLTYGIFTPSTPSATVDSIELITQVSGSAATGENGNDGIATRTNGITYNGLGDSINTVDLNVGTAQTGSSDSVETATQVGGSSFSATSDSLPDSNTGNPASSNSDSVI